jgi:hypothetical protein
VVVRVVGCCACSPWALLQGHQLTQQQQQQVEMSAQGLSTLLQQHFWPSLTQMQTAAALAAASSSSSSSVQMLVCSLYCLRCQWAWLQSRWELLLLLRPQ